jgi:protein-S-isoprenylcysteine O-methyltransferase Ste14
LRRHSPSEPSGLFLNALGWGLAFCSSVAIAMLMLVVVFARIEAEERLLRNRFGAEYEAYCARSRRLIPYLH